MMTTYRGERTGDREARWNPARRGWSPSRWARPPRAFPVKLAGPVLVALVACLLALLPGTAGSWGTAFAQPAETAGTDGPPRVVASTAWTAAIAQAAGADVAAVLAPWELRHPPERDFRPSDIAHVVAADYLVWAGYEQFIRQLMDAADIPADKVVHVQTANNPGHLVPLTRELARRWGTEDRQARWEQHFLEETARIEAAAAAKGTGQIRVVSSGHLKPFLDWLGYDVVATFGFDELTPVRIHELAGLEPHLVVDVWHNPAGEPLAEAAGVPYVQLINFPGRDGTRTLLDVFRHNAQQLGLLEE